MENKTLKVYRHELKFLLSQVEYRHLSMLFSALLMHDENMKHRGGYYIRSLYFDTPENMDYHNKIIGIAERKKIRLRIYEKNAESVKLEIKSKEKDYSIKETAAISREDAMRLIKGEYGALLNYDDAISKKAYFNMTAYMYMPKIIVDYDREAYLLPVENVRLTFDKGVRACKGSRLFDGESVFVGLLAPEYVILEVKYDKYIPMHIKNVLSSADMQRMSVSKYCMARERLG